MIFILEKLCMYSFTPSSIPTLSAYRQCPENPVYEDPGTSFWGQRTIPPRTCKEGPRLSCSCGAKNPGGRSHHSRIYPWKRKASHGPATPMWTAIGHRDASLTGRRAAWGQVVGQSMSRPLQVTKWGTTGWYWGDFRSQTGNHPNLSFPKGLAI